MTSHVITPSVIDHNRILHRAEKDIKHSKWAWPGTKKNTNCWQTHGTAKESHTTISGHQKDKLSKATRPRGYKTRVQSKTKIKRSYWLLAARVLKQPTIAFYLSLRMNSSFITSRPALSSPSTWDDNKNTVVPTKSDSDVTFCLQMLSKTFTFTLHLSLCESIDHLCINLIGLYRINTQLIFRW